MAESFYKLEDEAFPSFLGRSLDSTNGRATLGNVTLGSGPGLPVAASTVAKMRPQSDNRDGGDASYLEESELEHANSQLSEDKQAKFALSFKDDLDNADDFIAAHRLSEMLIKINLDESASRNQGSLLGLLPTQMGSVQGRHTEHPTDLPTGLLTFAQYGHKDCTNKKVPSLQATTDNNNVPSEAADSDHFSGSSSFLENEKLMSVDSMNSDITDDEIELNNLPDDELELYFRKLVPSAMQRGTVEGQELPATVLPRTSDDRSNSSSIEPEQYGHQIIDDYDQDNFQMPVVRLAATGMDSCPASDEDTEDELESARQTSNSTKNKLLPSISRQLVGESNHPSFRPGLEGGSSDDEWSSGLGGPSLSGIEHRRSAEGRVINPPVTGDGGGGDGSSGSEESGNDRGVSTIPIPTTNVPTTYDVLRGLGIVGSSAVGEDGDGGACSNLTGHGRNNCCTHAEMGDRVGPVGNGEASTSKTSSGGSHTLSPVNWSMIMDRQEALDAMENTESRMTSERAGSAYVKSETGLGRSLQEKSNFSQLQVTQDNFHNSKVPPSSNLRGGPCGNTSAAEASDVTSEEDNDYLSTSLEPKYFCQGVAEEQDHEWNTCPDSVELEFQKGANAPHSVVYQNEEGQWVTDLAYYSSFEKEVDEKATQNDGQFQTEDFVSAGDAFEKIVKDQEEFEKEHQFMQEEQIVPDSSNSAFQNDSWKAGTSSHILMRASQVSSEFNPGDQSYLRLSLGQFFEQRSEALGCLGSGNNVDAIKRPSFGYIITSPEKREPFALIQPSDFPNEESFPHSDSMEVSETDKTLSPDDLDKTFVVSGERVSPKGNTEPGLCEQKDHNSLEALLDCNMGPGSASNMWNQSGVSPQNNSSNLMLSISTIASAIADASISTDPSQLAAMIMELSKKSRARNRTEPAQPTGPEKFVVEPHPDEHCNPDEDQNGLSVTLQRRTCVEEQSALDIEKYLKIDMSGCSDTSVAHNTYDLTGWADISRTQKTQTGYIEEQSLAKQMDNETGAVKEDKVTRVEATKTSSSKISNANTLSSDDKDDLKRSSILRPHSSVSSLDSRKSSMPSVPVEKNAACDNTVCKTAKTSIFSARASSVFGTKLEELNPQISHGGCSSETYQSSHMGTSSSPRWKTHQSNTPCLKGSSAPIQKMSSTVQQQGVRQSNSPGKKTPTKILMAVPLSHCSVEKHVGFSFQNTPGDCASALPTESCGEERHCDFRPSTSPLTHSSPSQTSPPEANSTGSPSAASGILAGKCPGHDLSPQSTCSSPSLSRLTYISMNDATVVPTPGRQKSDCTMALSTTIIRFSPTPPMEQGPQSNENICSHSKSLDEVQSKHSKSLEQLPAQHCKNQDTTCGGSNLTCTRSQSECSYAGDKIDGLSANCRNCKNTTESDVKHLTKVDSGYISNSHIPQSVTTAAPHTSEQWGSASSIPSLFSGGLGIPQSYSSEGLHYRPIKFKTPHPGLIDIPHQGDMESLLAGPLVNSQLAQQFFGPNAPLNPGIYHMGATGTGLYSVPSSDVANGDPRVRHIHPTAQPLGIASATGSHHLSRSTQSHQDMGVLGKLYNQYGGEPMVTSCLDELRVQVVVPEELQFPHACCVGIASQTSLSIFNPSERWQQVSITVTSLSIDGEKVVNLPYQWLIVKSKTIIGPKSTEEQKVLFIPPKAGVYQCVLSVCSWPTPTNREVADRASIFARRVVLVAIAENPSVEVEVGNSGCLDFGDLPGGSSKSLLLKLLNMTRATVPIRLVISAKATAWRCFTLSKQQVSVTSEATQPAGHMASLSTSVVNHVMHANYGENPECFMVWVHFKALQKYTTSSGDLGPAEDYSARVDIEVDSPGASHVIKSIPIRARSGTVRVHAPKDLQTVCLRAPLGKSCQTTLPLKNAGNIDVWMKLKCNEDCFSVKPDELFLTVGEEQGIVVSFKPRGSKKYKASLLTILVLPSGPQYEVKLNGEVVSEESVTSAAPVLSSCLGSDVPPILSNKQFVAWGGVTLGRAVQQKLVLRNNSSNATQQLRLLIRGQDQDCFQLQSLFSPEERLTRHGELSIRPQEDVTIHLLFAPTRVACMLAKLEIKQSAVRPSQPGVKFTIPLSGYGGTSNIILEDQRKQADGYVVTVSDIAINHVSKVCLCVRNTGSRAAFIKAVAFSDVMTRSVMDPFVISLAPSQFVLKERTQEAITVLMKSTQREQTLCQSDTPLLATVVLFCGDEVSRQQYRRLLQSKPDAGQKVLAENSLLKIIDFNDKFLGEEITTEPFDLPQRPNEAYIFYGHVGKVAVSLLGSTYSKEYEQSDSPEMMLTSAIQDLVTESGMVNGNVSLDVLPVKGPQGPAIRVTGCSLKTSEPALRHSGSWTVHPEQLVLGAPTMNAVASTNQVQIKNNTSRELSFDLSWPAHYLTITPQHGVIEPQCHLQILISPNPSLASKSDMLPWNGTIYVLCDGQQKLIKVQIRQDLVLDVSAAPGDVTLSALPPQAATPVLPAVRITSKSTLPLSPLQLPQALVEIPNKNIIFSDTPSGETSETHLDVENGEMDVRWYISSFAPPYVKGVDNSCDVYRATYTAFRCSRVSGTLGAHEKMQVPITFLPRDRGDYAQFWDLECHPLSEPLQKYRIRFQLCGTGINSGPIEGLQEGDCSLVKTETTIKTRKKAEVSTSKTSVNQEEAEWRGVYTPQDVYTFPDTRIGEFSSLKVNIRNNSPNTHELRFVNPREPFHIKHSKYSLRSQHYLKLPVQFKPSTAGRHAGLLLIQSETNGSLVVQLTGRSCLSTPS
ncbi:centrosomal protein of 192 kDa isoform X3 [Phyllopteryx taeniolatus]|uniref:centrosomal protein of 192 kDa isoform X3 n=1 Tax=Phyllopteryx taeniolatus TaxID=161469 RepID=UPI002AD2E20E|nr:centrosomal protein of 192 kDa isoform X3 [Phyllopteryx taeniolatus]